jgi:hypothetical protein
MKLIRLNRKKPIRQAGSNFRMKQTTALGIHTGSCASNFFDLRVSSRSCGMFSSS